MRLFSAKVQCLLITMICITSFNACKSTDAVSNGEIPLQANYVITLSLDGSAEVQVNYMLSNSGSEIAYGKITVDFIETHNIISNIEPELICRRSLEAKNNLTAYEAGGTTRINGTVYDFFVEPYEIVHVRIKYRISDACSFNSENLTTVDNSYLFDHRIFTRGEKASLALGIPLYSDFFRICKLDFYYLAPQPTIIMDDRDYRWLIWSNPTRVLEDGRFTFDPIVVFRYGLDISLIFYLTVGFIIAFFAEHLLKGTLSYCYYKWTERRKR